MLTSMLLACVATAGATGSALEPANPDATPAARSVLRYLSELPSKEQDRVLSGQHCGRGGEAESLYQEHIVEVYRQTGHPIAMAGTDYGRGRNDTVAPDRRAANQVLIDHWKTLRDHRNRPPAFAPRHL